MTDEETMVQNRGLGKLLLLVGDQTRPKPPPPLGAQGACPALCVQPHPLPSPPAWSHSNPLQTCLCPVTFFSIFSQSELPLTDREMEILNKTTGMLQSTELLPDSTDEEVAPPKPPLPGIRVVDNR